GTNAMPETYAAIWGEIAARCDGGMLYSEGIFEDLNKAVYAGFYWNRDNSYEDTLRRYAAFEFGLQSREDLGKFERLVQILEANVLFALLRDKSDSEPGYDLTHHEYKRIKYCDDIAWSKGIQKDDPEEALGIVRELESGMPDWAKTSWRWRLFALRAQIDAERFAHNIDITERCADYFEELKDIYYADETLPFAHLVCPPTRKSIIRRTDCNPLR
ncbi:MAG: hypothetical protein PHT33_14155, partial [bacterium]|nr:hypothetical protein [bacterium]